MAEPVLEASHDYALAKLLGCSVDSVREERSAAFTTLQARMREKGYDVPDDLTEFAEWCKGILRDYV